MNIRNLTLSLVTALCAASTPSLAVESAASAAEAKKALQAKLVSICDECAVVKSIKAVERKPKGSGVGIVGGALVGGLVGNQFGRGTGKTVATGAGVVAGGIAGNAIERNANKYTVWVVRATLKSGIEKTFEQRSAPNFRAGDVMRVQSNQLMVK